MKNAKIEKLLARQQAIKDAIRLETRQARVRKQKALFAAVQRAGLLDLSDDQIDAALQAYKPQATENSGEDGSQA